MLEMIRREGGEEGREGGRGRGKESLQCSLCSSFVWRLVDRLLASSLTPAVPSLYCVHFDGAVREGEGGREGRREGEEGEGGRKREGRREEGEREGGSEEREGDRRVASGMKEVGWSEEMRVIKYSCFLQSLTYIHVALFAHGQ